MATHSERYTLSNDSTYRGQVETALLKRAYVQLNTAITAGMTDTQKKKLRAEQRFALVLRQDIGRYVIPAAKLIAANVGNAMIDTTGQVPSMTDADLDTVMPVAFSVLAATELTYFDETAPVVS